MDGEEEKISGVMKREKPDEVGVNSDDDEPIGTLLKLKKPRKVKKVRLSLEADGGAGSRVEVTKAKTGAVEDDRFGGMDDTLASFRRKLKGPKRDSGLKNTRDRNLSSEEADSLKQSLSLKDGSIDAESVRDIVEMGHSVRKKGSHKNPDKSNRKKVGKQKLDRVKILGNSISKSCDDSGILKLQKGAGVSAEELDDEVLEDLLLSFLGKAQAGVVKKAKNALGSKPRRGKIIKKSNPSGDSSRGYKGTLNSIPERKISSCSSTVKSAHKNQKKWSSHGHAVLAGNECIQVENRSSDENNCSASRQNHNMAMGLDSSQEVYPPESCVSEKICSGDVKITSTEGNEIILAVEDLMASKLGKYGYEGGGTDVIYGDKADISMSSAGNEVQGHLLDSKLLNKSCADALENVQRLSNGSNPGAPMNTVENVLSKSGLKNSSHKGATPANDDTAMDEIPDENDNPLPDFGDKQIKLSAEQRRKAKKYRREDMAYEGDAEWDTLLCEQAFGSYHLIDNDRPYKSRGKVDSSVNGSAAAVSVGLKARAAGPAEKIKFKEIFKRKGGLQEYLECRNRILSLWNRDISRILSLTDCGVTDIPLEDESPRAPLIREIYTFLDQSGYINIGVACAKQNAYFNGGKDVGPSVGEKFEMSSAILCTDSEQRITSNVIDSKISDTALADKCDKPEDTECLQEKLELPSATNNKDCREKDNFDIDLTDTKLSEKSVGLDVFPNVPTTRQEIVDSGNILVETPKTTSDSNLCGSSLSFSAGCDSDARHDRDVGKRIIVIGAGPAGLTAARHLKRQGFSVTVLEARSRIGGRVYTDRSSLSVPVDLGASIITGVEADVTSERRPDPSSLICTQLGIELTVLNSDCPLYDVVTGQKVPSDLDKALEAEYNSLIDDMVLVVAQNGEREMKMSLEDGLEYALKVRRMVGNGADPGGHERKDCSLAPVDSKSITGNEAPDKSGSTDEDILSPLERRVMNWHFAHLEYGCAAALKEVSLPNWNQDDVYGGFGGAHCMIKGGFSSIVESLGQGLNILLDHVVTEISYSSKDFKTTEDHLSSVKVSTSNGNEFSGDAVLVTVPLGCLKAESIKFFPPLPQWKQSSIDRLGFGVLNKVVLEFPEAFWDDSVDYFGATAEATDCRGQCFMFWNIQKTVGAPVLIALLVGKAAKNGERVNSQEHVDHAIMVLQKLFGEASVPNPVGSVVTDWGRDPFSYGAYSYVAIGASGEDYDIIGKPIENCLFFAGEATCKEHPDTVGGAMMSGLREAVRIMDILNTGNDYRAEVEALEAAQRQSDGERDEVGDITKRLDAPEISNYLYKNILEGDQILSKESLLRDLFFTSKTTSGRLLVAKALLNIPIEALKTFAGNKEGLSTLNSWILDSMGKDGTQLLRHCVRLLVLVSDDLLAIRLSGIGKTVKEKVCVHTSRDIRAIASQLVNVWLEVFRKEKASNGKLNLLKQTIGMDSSKIRSTRESLPGKTHLCAQHDPSDGKGNLHSSVSSGSQAACSGGKNLKGRHTKLETINDSKSESASSRSRGSVGRHDSRIEADETIPMSDEEKAAFAAAEAARAKAIAAAEAFATAETKYNAMMQLPKIPSFQKFARREQYAQWPGGVLGRQDCVSEIDSRNCRVRDWSADSPAAFVSLDNTRFSLDNRSQRSHSNEVTGQLNLAENSGESVAVDSSIFTKAWVDASGSECGKDYHAIERWQSQAAAAESDFYNSNIHLMDEGDSNTDSRSAATWRNEKIVNESSLSQVTLIQDSKDNQQRGVEQIKHAVVDYVASLLMPLYKARKIDRDGYKSIMKKTATKVMEQATDVEKSMAVYQFLDYKRKNKIRAFVDILIERHMVAKSAVKP
ncbi:hypothetical protein SAY86_016207 [Trapa natans]|uniref:SWIRM domain-containing protein n=1 Tax=Trapa natans TaxID=22666 RepID=A0AAN7QZN6_TRANT|nr:hypothetical protein SAY86_016207 [Trapa natans]